MRIATIVGARPQFVKLALVSKALRKKHKEILIHTGQHYGPEMSKIFFEELELPKPEYSLGIGPGSPAWQVGAMLIELEKLLTKLKPDVVLVYGDTHTTLAGALAAAKLNIPLAHVEAGLRSCHPTMQEEKNRIVTDHLSQILFCPTQTAVGNLKKEGISRGVHLVGDVMMNTLKFFLPIAQKKSSILSKLSIAPKTYFLATIHRAENADQKKRMQDLAQALSCFALPVILPLHPRTSKELKKNKVRFGSSVQLIEPVGYLDMLVLEKNAKLILTDSGGVQKEAYFLQVPCVTLREETEWLETVEQGWNLLAGASPERIERAARLLLSKPKKPFKPNLFGPGNVAEKIAKILERVNRHKI